MRHVGWHTLFMHCSIGGSILKLIHGLQQLRLEGTLEGNYLNVRAVAVLASDRDDTLVVISIASIQLDAKA